MTLASAPISAADQLAPQPSLGRARGLWGLLIFSSAFLLFAVQPILAKLILPWFGGAAAVWLTSLAFFQAAYLLGNLYAHLLLRRLSSRDSGRVHALALLASLLFLPVIPRPFWQPLPGQEPAWQIVGLLGATAGLPFLLLSATSPLLQAWYARRNSGALPYRFYALSNAGSLLALVSYPVAIEPHMATHRQAQIWSVAYAAFVAAGFWLSLRHSKSHPAPDGLPSAACKPSLKTRLLWLFLAADASALLLAITHHVSKDIAAIPLLWIAPLSVYLLTLILCFTSPRWYQRPLLLRLLPVALGSMAYALLPDFENAPPQLLIPLFLGGLFVCCMVCHGEMARTKPQPAFLSAFYLMLSAGGALGGLLAAIAAPHLFRGFYELPIALACCAVLACLALLRDPPPSSRPALLAAALITLALTAFCGLVIARQSRQAMVMARNFYGVLRVNDLPAAGIRPAMRQLRNGTIIHGAQILNFEKRRTPTTYYAPQSGAGIALRAARGQGPLRAGIIGLGAGTLASYGRPGDVFTFYEINPLDVDLAQTQFDFLRASQAQIEIIPGDARLSLQRQPSQNFDVLLVDAFSGDAIPVHLLTREAFQLYFRHLKRGGLLAVHVSNRFLDLPPVVAASARAAGAHSVKITNPEDPSAAIFQSTWMLARRDGPETGLLTAASLQSLLPEGASAEQVQRTVPVWTDDYSNLFEILK